MPISGPPAQGAGLGSGSSDRSWSIKFQDGQGNLVNAADSTNDAIKVNVVAGGAGGGLAQLQVRNLGDGNWINVGVDHESTSGSHLPVRIFGTSSFSVEPFNVDPPTTAWAVPVRTVGGGSNVTVISGSITGLLVGGQAVNQANSVPISASATVRISPSNSQTSVTSVTATLQPGAVLLYPNVYRSGTAVFNDSPSSAFLRLGTSVNSSNFTVLMNNYSYYETPYGYAGALTMAWITATGSARVTEFV